MVKFPEIPFFLFQITGIPILKMLVKHILLLRISKLSIINTHLKIGYYVKKYIFFKINKISAYLIRIHYLEFEGGMHFLDVFLAFHFFEETCDTQFSNMY